MKLTRNQNRLNEQNARRTEAQTARASMMLPYHAKCRFLYAIKAQPTFAAKLASTIKQSDMYDQIGSVSQKYLSGDPSRISKGGARSARDGRGQHHKVNGEWVSNSVQTHVGKAGFMADCHSIGSADLPVAFASLASASASADIERPEVSSEE